MLIGGEGMEDGRFGGRPGAFGELRRGRAGQTRKLCWVPNKVAEYRQL